MRFVFAAVLLSALAWPGVCDARQQNQDVTNVTFDHFAASGESGRPERARTVTLRDGEQFLVTVQRTCVDAFEYTIRGVLKEPAAGPRPSARPRPETLKPLSDKRIGPTAHDDRFGGYIVDVISKADADPCVVSAGSEEEASLKDAQFFVNVTTDEWDYSVSGGFAFSAPGGRKYALAPKAGSDTVMIVTRDEDNEADAVTSAGAFVHLFRSAGIFHTVAPTFGISVETDDKAAYFGGIGWRLGRVATLIGGVSLSQLSVLPGGVGVGSETENAALLDNLPTESKLRFMVGISFAFLPGGNSIKKPFAGEDNQPGEGK